MLSFAKTGFLYFHDPQERSYLKIISFQVSQNQKVIEEINSLAMPGLYQ